MRPIYCMCDGDWLSLELTSGGGGIRLWWCARLFFWVIGRSGMF